MDPKYQIYRILVIDKDGNRRSQGVHVPTDNLELSRKVFKKMFPRTKRVLLSYHEREEE